MILQHLIGSSHNTFLDHLTKNVFGSSHNDLRSSHNMTEDHLTCYGIISHVFGSSQTCLGIISNCILLQRKALMQKSDPPQFCHYKCIFANIWYLILLIQSIIIILRIFMFYKQRVLAYFWGRKDSAICASRKRSGALCTWNER